MRKWLAVAMMALFAVPGWAQEPKRYIVGFRPDSDQFQRAAALEKFGLKFLEDIKELNAEIVEEAPGGIRATSMQMMADSDILVVEEDFYANWLVDSGVSFQQMPLPSLSSVMNSLPRFHKKDATQQEMPWGVVRVNAKQAWSRTRGQGVRVAVVDTGVDCDHPDLAPNCVDGYNAFDAKDAPKDDNGHGTHVAGTIAAVANGKGVVGVAPGAKIIPVKVLDASGGARLTSIIKGLIYVGRTGPDIVNMSLGSSRGSIFMRLAISYAGSSGAVIVAAAGNSGGKVEYPAAYSGTIAVSASNSNDKIAGFSSRGKQVDFIAPGVGVKSTVPGGGYARYSGTSMATPHVAGLAALAVAQGAKGREEVKRALRGAAAPLSGLSDKEQGEGMIDASKIHVYQGRRKY